MPENEMLHPILYVDDEEDNLTVFRAAFRQDYNIYLASPGPEGLKIMEEHEIQLVIADQGMPVMSGIEFLEQVKNSYPNCIRMVLSGFTDMEAIIQAINKGRVYRYITKPWDKNDLKITIDRAIEFGDLKSQHLFEGDLIRNLELTGKLLGELGSGVTINTVLLAGHPEYLQLRHSLMAALRKYPKARQAVMTALRTVEAPPVIEGKVEYANT